MTKIVVFVSRGEANHPHERAKNTGVDEVVRELVMSAHRSKHKRRSLRSLAPTSSTPGG